MAWLNVTLIDVGWGDSIFIESGEDDGTRHYALVDSNDTQSQQPSAMFLMKHFKIAKTKLKQSHPIFDFVLLTHDHTDHASGLKQLIKLFGARRFYYPKVPVEEAGSLGSLQQWANSANGKKYIGLHEALDADKDFSSDPPLGTTVVDVLWPPQDHHVQDTNPNNHSVVLTLTRGNVTFVLTGDAEIPVWRLIADRIPDTTRMFKLPHHGSVNGTYEDHEGPWLAKCPTDRVELGISCHPTYPRGFPSHPHPHHEVIDKLEQEGYLYRRTDRDYHITFSTDGTDVWRRCAYGTDPGNA
jgi:beta-lactamase superfamily II metal-dependent hydrolase